MITELKSHLKKAMIEKNETEKNILRLVIGEVEQLQLSRQQGNKPVSEEQIAKILRKLMQSNNESIAATKNDEQKSALGAENVFIESLLPKQLTESQIADKLSSIQTEIKEAKSEGQAVGVAMKLLKQTNESVDGSVVKKVVLSLRV